MAKAFFKNISKSVCIYLLAVNNLAHALKHGSLDWLDWLSISLCVLSVGFAYVTAKGDQNA